MKGLDVASSAFTGRKQHMLLFPGRFPNQTHPGSFVLLEITNVNKRVIAHV